MVATVVGELARVRSLLRELSRVSAPELPSVDQGHGRSPGSLADAAAPPGALGERELLQLRRGSSARDPAASAEGPGQAVRFHESEQETANPLRGSGSALASQPPILSEQ